MGENEKSDRLTDLFPAEDNPQQPLTSTCSCCKYATFSCFLHSVVRSGVLPRTLCSKRTPERQRMISPLKGILHFKYDKGLLVVSVVSTVILDVFRASFLEFIREMVVTERHEFKVVDIGVAFRCHFRCFLKVDIV